MNSDNLKNIIKAILFSTHEPLTHKKIAEVIAAGVTLDDSPGEVSPVIKHSEIEPLIAEMNQDLAQSHDVFRILEGPHGAYLATMPQYAPWVEVTRDGTKATRLSGAMYEVLALIAYRQPITRAEMEMIRGVSVDSALTRLQEWGLVESKERANLPGKPRLFEVSEKFFEFCGITSLEDLPRADIMSPEVISDWVKEKTKHQGEASELGLDD